MNFLRLNDYLLSVLFEDHEILAIDKPYGINSHTNDAKIGNSDFIQDGLIEIYEKQRQIKLHIVHRLDQTTTGVIIFAKSPEAAKKYADFFLNRQVKKTYWFITSSSSTKENYTVEQSIIHKGKELNAKTEFNLLKKNSTFSLWQANPLTGRNHQIRIHAKAAEIPVLGDDKYDGGSFPFLCLHNHRIEFPNGLVIKSVAPKYFIDLNLLGLGLEKKILAKALFEVDRRLRLFSSECILGNEEEKQCLRLVHSKNDSQDFAFTLDQFGKILALSCYNESWTSFHGEAFSYLATYMHKPIFVRHMHNRGKDPLNKSQFVIYPTVSHESNSEENSETIASVWVAKENNIQYEMRLDSGQSFGLFLDQRLQRNWVLNNTKNKSVLNLFSYTCGFSVAAALGGARQVISVDTSKSALQWGKRNFTLNAINNLDQEKYKFLARDSLDFLQICIKKNIKYDLIICDPPSFSRSEKGVFKIESSLELLLENCLASLFPGGQLLFSTNFEPFFIDDIRKSILTAKTSLGLGKLEVNCIQPGLDFELSGEKPILKSFLIKI